MSRLRALLAVALPPAVALAMACLPACSGDDTIHDGGHDGGNDDPLGFDPERGGTWDGSACAAPTALDPGTLRCGADPDAARFALAVCGDLDTPNTLDVEARAGGAALAVDGDASTSSPLHVAGPMTVTGYLDADNTQDIDGPLQVGGDWSTSSPVHVTGDVFLGGALQATNTVTIGGTLHVPVAPDAQSLDAGSVSVGPVSVAPPLACAAAPDVAALVDAWLDQEWPGEDGTPWPNGNLVHDALANVRGPTELTLGCGRYRFSSIGAHNTLTLRIVGPTVLVVDGDVRVASPMRVVVEGDATLDMAIAGSLQIDNTLDVGNPARPEATWLAVAGEVRVASPFELDGWLLASRAAVRGDNTIDVHGAAYVGPLRVASPMVVDPALSFDGAGCVAPLASD